MDTIELWNGTTKALIDPIGAWLTNLSDDNGAVLYPKRTLVNESGERKQRGGCHVCLPNFGPGGASGQPQHGFGREMIWNIVEAQSAFATLELVGGAAGYEQLVSRLSYTLNPRSLEVLLHLNNTGEAPLRVAPGFHPYFVLNDDEEEVTLNSQSYLTDDLAGTELFPDVREMRLSLRRHAITISSDNLSTWAFWTDKLAEYVCVEPTFGGNTFLHEASEKEWLAPGEERTFAMTIQW